MPRRAACRPGFTFVHLVVCAFIAAILFLVLGVLANRLRENANRQYCASNLSQLYNALQQYAKIEHGLFPRARFRIPALPEDRTTPCAYTHFDAVGPFLDTGPNDCDVTAAMYLLVLELNVSPKVFTCPSAPEKAWDFSGQRAANFSNFPGRDCLGYSMQNPYPTIEAIVDGFRWSAGVDPGFPLMADINPGTPAVTTLRLGSSKTEMMLGNSPNHLRKGQNVLFGDGHVAFEDSPFVGIGQDSIYGFGNAADEHDQTRPDAVGIWGGARSRNDSILLPTADDRTATSLR